MAHIRCKHCGLETLDDKAIACPHKSTCRTAGKPEDYDVLGDESKPKRAIQQAKAVTPKASTASPKKTTTTATRGSGRKSRK